jgi:hypothetical protein
MTGLRAVVRSAVAALALACVAWPALGQITGPGHSLSVQLDNDELVGFSKRDRWYSQALRIHHFAPAAADSWAGALAERWCALQACAVSTRVVRRWSLGQNIYTQNSRSLPLPDPLDRPTAGWSYLSGAALLETADETRMAELVVGLVGPASLAGTMQNRVHHILNVSPARGWDTQVRPRLGVQLQWLQERRLALVGSTLDLVGRTSVSLGSVSGQAGAGVVLRFGDRLSGTATAAEAQTATGRIGSGGRWSLQAGVAVRAVAWDYLIDGPAFGYTSQVRAAPWVGEVHAGATWSFENDWHLRFALLRRTIEFDSTAVAEGRFAPQTFGTLQLSVPLR